MTELLLEVINHNQLLEYMLKQNCKIFTKKLDVYELFSSSSLTIRQVFKVITESAEKAVRETENDIAAHLN